MKERKNTVAVEKVVAKNDVGADLVLTSKRKRDTANYKYGKFIRDSVIAIFTITLCRSQQLGLIL